VAAPGLGPLADLFAISKGFGHGVALLVATGTIATPPAWFRRQFPSRPTPAKTRCAAVGASMTKPSNRILLGQIGAAHGIKGGVRIATHTQDPLAIGSYGPLDTDRPGLTITLNKIRLQKNVVIAHIKGVSDRNAAEALNGVSLFVDRSK